MDPVTERALRLFGTILMTVSALICLSVALLKLDYLPATLLGVAIIILNYLATRRVVLSLFSTGGSKGRMVLLYCLKLGFSLVVLYLSVVQLRLPAIGLLVGLSNIVLASLIYTIAQVFFPPPQDQPLSEVTTKISS